MTINRRSIQKFDLEDVSSEQSFLGKVTTLKVDRLLVKQGKHIIVEPSPDAIEGAVRSLILGPLFAILLRQRGMLVLHASGVAGSNGVIAFIGNSGWGKSTLANAFCNQGYSLITDDVMAIQMNENIPIALPAYPEVKLLPDAADALGYDFDTLTPIFSAAEKRHNHIDCFLPNVPLQLRKIYVLENISREAHEIVPLSSQAAVIELIRHTRSTNVLTDASIVSTHLHQCTQLIQSIPVCLLKRQRSLDKLPELLELIEADMVATAFSTYESQQSLLPISV